SPVRLLLRSRLLVSCLLSLSPPRPPPLSLHDALPISGAPFHYPTNLAVGPAGDLYVADGYGNARIHRFAPDGRLLQSWGEPGGRDRKSTRLNSSHQIISYAVFCLKKKKPAINRQTNRL